MEIEENVVYVEAEDEFESDESLECHMDVDVKSLEPLTRRQLKLIEHASFEEDPSTPLRNTQ